MKRILLAGAALGALTLGAQAADPVRYNPVTAGPASQAVSGDLAIYGGFYSWGDEDDDNKSGTVIGGLARANIWLSPGMSLQIDLFGEHTSEGDGYGPAVTDVAGHLSWRSPGQLLGVFASLGSAWGDRSGTIGIEGQTYLGPILLYGQAGLAHTLVDEYTARSWYIHGVGTYFINPNLALSGNVGFGSLFESGCCYYEDTGSVFRWGIDLETKFSQTFGGFVAYNGAHVTDDGWSATSHTFTVGLKVNFNNNTLQSQAQAGAALKNFSPFTGVNNIAHTW